MTADEFTALTARIEALWPASVWVDETQAAAVFEYYEPVTLTAALEAVDLAFGHGQAWPPKPAQLRATAAHVDRRLRDARSLPSDTGRQPAAVFAATHDGYSPSQWAKRLAGIDPGPPRFLSQPTRAAIQD